VIARVHVDFHRNQRILADERLVGQRKRFIGEHRRISEPVDVVDVNLGCPVTDDAGVPHGPRCASHVEAHRAKESEQCIARGPARAACPVREKSLEEFGRVDAWKKSGRSVSDSDQLCSIVEWDARAPGAIDTTKPVEIAFDIATNPKPVENAIEQDGVQGFRCGAGLPSILIFRLSSSSFDCIWNIVIITSAVALDLTESGSVASRLTMMVESPFAKTESTRVAVTGRFPTVFISRTIRWSGTTSFTIQIMGAGFIPRVARSSTRIESPG